MYLFRNFYAQLSIMKHFFIITAFLLIGGASLFSQVKPYNVVFDLTSGDTAVHQRVIRWINGIVGSDPNAKIEIVFYGKSLPMVETRESSVAAEVKKLAAGKNVIFAVCEQAMKVHHVDKSMLLPGVKTVPDAIYELISKQADGFGYIKITN
jgi:intracellular sulfur oxidation DsrE/DsrF family protein